MDAYLIKILLRFTCAVSLWMTALAAPAAELKIVAAENFYGGVAQQIAGDGATVKSILTNPNQDPHEFTTNASTAKAVADADIVIYNGLSYDPWMEKLLATKCKPGRVVIKVSDLIDAKEGDNPHIWYNLATMPALAKKLAVVLLMRGDSCGSRRAAFDAEMKTVSERILDLRAAAAGREVTATEPVFGYMADALGFKMLNYDFQIKIMNDAEPTADETAVFEKSLTSKTAKILFYNSQVSDPTTERIQKIAKKSGVPVVGVTETQPPDQKSYVGWMMRELDGVQAALGARTQGQ